MFRTRLVSGIILVALALLFIITGGRILLVSTAVISLIGLFELYRVFKIEKTCLAFLGYIVTGIFYANLQFAFLPEHMMFVILFMIALLCIYVLSYPKFDAKQVIEAFFGVFYVAVMLSYIYQTRMNIQKGEYIVWLIFLCSWGCDTFAYCFGMLFGKHKMSPVLSPKKSIEGAVGGVLGAVFLTALYCFIFMGQMKLSLVEVWILAGISGIGALISMIGDLAASAIKRNYEIKDYGTLIPGHGGILDRFDSVIITAPIIYYLALNLISR